jgi:hypothetical protein
MTGQAGAHVTALAIAATLLVSSPVADSPVLVERASFAPTLEVPGARLILEGAGLFRWKYFLKVYAAAHYVGEGARGQPADSDVPRRLEIAYFVGIQGEDFGKAADELLGEALPADQLAPLRARLEELHRAYVDVKEGDRYALTYVPGRGTELTLNGAPLALIPGADFARAYFGIWIGNRPIDRGLRDALVKGTSRPQP